MRLFRSPLFLCFLSTFLFDAYVSAQEPDTTAQPLSSKDRKKREKALHRELSDPFNSWLNEDVYYIITPEEKATFLGLSTNEERDQFIEHFWYVRNPDPDSPDNSAKEEHYRRIAYANERFASGVAGWRTDRGHIYILWGPPDEIDSHPTGGTYDRPMDEGGGTTSTYPWEKWRYRHLEGIGENIELEFVDPSGSGEYHLTRDPGEKDALAKVPGAGLSVLEVLGLSSKAQRFTNSDGTTLPAVLGGRSASMDEFEKLDQYTNVQRAPHYREMDAFVSTRVVRNQIKVDYSLDYLRVTADSVLVPITMQVSNRQLEFRLRNGVHSAMFNVYGRITSPIGRVVQTFDESIARDFPDSLFQSSLNLDCLYQKSVALRPGLYRLDLVVKDEASGNVGVIGTALRVPHYADDHLDASSLILADLIAPVPSREVGLGPFVIGSRKIRPRLNHTFFAAEKMGVFVQFYNLKPDPSSNKTNGSVLYRILKGNDEVWRAEELSGQLHQNGEQLTIERFVPLSTLPPGDYLLEIRATDKVTQDVLLRTASFTVKPPPHL
jgi:GWxTD domain-containing protein